MSHDSLPNIDLGNDLDYWYMSYEDWKVLLKHFSHTTLLLILSICRIITKFDKNTKQPGLFTYHGFTKFLRNLENESNKSR